MRLVTFGCSITYGQALEDTNWAVYRGVTPPSKLAWPAKLADILNVEVVNTAIPGAGNYLIAHQIINYKPKDNDIVVVMWSFKDRYNIITEVGNDDYNTHFHKTIGPWTKDTRSEAYYKYIYDEDDALIRSNHLINYSQLYLDTLNIKHLHTMPHDEKYSNVVNLGINKLRVIDLADDNSHPGPKSHLAIAEKIYDYIKNNLN